jgi:hypothetical protein
MKERRRGEEQRIEKIVHPLCLSVAVSICTTQKTAFHARRFLYVYAIGHWNSDYELHEISEPGLNGGRCSAVGGPMGTTETLRIRAIKRHLNIM